MHVDDNVLPLRLAAMAIGFARMGHVGRRPHDGFGVPTFAARIASRGGRALKTGEQARAFALVSVTTPESADGLTYAQMGRYRPSASNPAGTSDEEAG